MKGVGRAKAKIHTMLINVFIGVIVTNIHAYICYKKLLLFGKRIFLNIQNNKNSQLN